MNLCKIQSHRVGEAWGGVGRGGILNWIVVIFNLIIYIYRYKNNTLFTHSLGVELVFGKTLFSQDDLRRSQKYFKRVKDIVYLWKTLFISQWLLVEINHLLMDTGRTFIMTACSVDRELVSSECSVALLCSHWIVRLLWIVFLGTFTTRLKYQTHLMTPIQSVRGLSGGTRNNHFPTHLTPRALFICWKTDD